MEISVAVTRRDYITQEARIGRFLDMDGAAVTIPATTT
jgi:hypothetical protein